MLLISALGSMTDSPNLAPTPSPNPVQHPHTLENPMNRKATRILVAVIATLSFAGATVPAEAAPLKMNLRNVWCC